MAQFIANTDFFVFPTFVGVTAVHTQPPN